MPRTTRIVLFFFCLLLFVVIAPSVILYSQGFRIDFENKKIIKTGGLYFKIAPKGAEVFVDSVLKKRTDAFFGSAFIESLLPKKYFVEITKPKYLSWKKHLEVWAEQVSEAKNIVLFPQDLDSKIIAQEIKQMFFSPKQDILVFKQNILWEGTQEGEAVKQEIWALKLYDPKRNIKSHLINEREIFAPGASSPTILKNLDWSFNQKVLLLTLEEQQQEKKENKYFLLDLEKNPVIAQSLKLPKQAINPFPHPQDSNKVFFQGQTGNSTALFELNLQDQTSSPILEQLLAYKLSDNSIFWLSQDGIFKKSSLSGQTTTISLVPLSVKQDVKYQIFVLNSFIFLKENNALFFFNQETQSFQEISNGVKSFVLSPDNKKICFWNDFEIWAYFLSPELGQPQREKGDKIFLTRFSEKIDDVFFYDAHHLIFNTESGIKAVELDNRDKIQTWDLAEFIGSKIYWSSQHKKLYILNSEKVFVSKTL